MSKRKSISKATRLKVYEKNDGHCPYCGAKMDKEEYQE